MNKNIKIGPVQLSVDADSFSISDRKVNTMVPGLRSNIPKVINTGKSRLEYSFSAIFANEEEINTKLRPIIAYFKAVPFITVKSDVLNKLLATRLVSKAVANQSSSYDKLGSNFIQNKLISDLRNAIYEHLLDPIVKSYMNLTVIDKTIIDQFIKEKLGVSLDDINRPALRTLVSRYVELNYYVSKATIPIKGGSNEQQIRELRKHIREKLAGQLKERDVIDRAKTAGIVQVADASDVYDGDTFVVSGTTYRLFGVDAFETVRPGTQLGPGQEKKPEKSYAASAKSFLVDRLVGQNFTLSEVGTRTYNRVLGICESVSPSHGENANVGLEMVSQGIALPSGVASMGRYATIESLPYLKAAKTAAESGLGIWSQSEIQVPELWRKYAQNINNFANPSSPTVLDSDIQELTIKPASVLKQLIDSLIEELEGRTPNIGINFVASAQPILDAYEQSIVSEDKKKEDVDRVSEFIGFPEDLIPSCFAGISYSAVHDLPQAIQAQFHFSVFNHAPYGPTFGFKSDVVQQNGVSAVVSDPDITYSRLVQGYVSKEFLEEPASKQYLTAYTPAKDFTIHYNDVDTIVKKTSKAKLRESDIKTSERVQKSKEMLNKRESVVFIGKRITISPDSGEIEISILEDEEKKQSTVHKLNNIQIESVSCNITNNIVHLPIEAAAIPTAQHIGRGIGSVSLEISSTDENSMAVFRTLEHAIQNAMHISNQYGAPTSFRITNPTINLSGAKDFVFDNIVVSNDRSAPGKYNMRINLVESFNAEEDTEEKLIPKIDFDFKDGSGVAKKVVEALKEHAGSPFYDKFMSTFFPMTKPSRSVSSDIEEYVNTYPLMLLFAHTHKDTPNPVLLDAYGENIGFIESFSNIVNRVKYDNITPKAVNMRDNLIERLYQIDRAWFVDIASSLPINISTAINERNPFSTASSVQDDVRKFSNQSIVFDKDNYNPSYLIKGGKWVIGPWGKGPGATAGSTDAMLNRRDYFLQFLSTKDFTKKYLLNLSQGCFSAAYYFRNLFEDELDSNEQAKKAFYNCISFLLSEALESSPNFEGFFGAWITRQVGLYSEDLDRSLLPTRQEPTTFNDLNLPTYRDVFGKTDSVVIEERKKLISDLRAISIYIPEISYNVDTISSPYQFYSDIVTQYHVGKSNIGLHMISGSNLYRSQDKALDNVYDTAVEIYSKETETMKSRLPVSDAVLPRNKEFWSRLDPNAIARSPDDVVEPGWMYDLQWEDVSDTASVTMNHLKKVHSNNVNKISPITTNDLEDNDILNNYEDLTVGDNYIEKIKEVSSKKRMFKGSQIGDINFAEVPLQSISSVDKSKKKYPSSGTSTTTNLPGSFSTDSIDTDRHTNRLTRDRYKDDKISSIRKAYPGYAIYFLEEDAEDWGYLDDYYRYDSVISWDVVQSKKDIDTAVVKFTNFKGVLSNQSPNKDRLKDEVVSATETVDESISEPVDPNSAYEGDLSGLEGLLTAFKLRQGTRIIIKSGFTTKISEMETIFTGQVVEVSPGDIITVICQGYGSQLMSSMNKEFMWDDHNFPEILSTVLYDTTYFGKWERFVDRLPGQSKMYSGTVGSIISHKLIGDYFPSTADDNIYRIAKPHDNFFKWMWDWAWGTNWQIRGPIWSNILTMTRYVPNTILTIRPYDGRATLIWNDYDGYYIDTNHISSLSSQIGHAASDYLLRSGLKQNDNQTKSEMLGEILSNDIFTSNGSSSPYMRSEQRLSDARSNLYNHGIYDFNDKIDLINEELILTILSDWFMDKFLKNIIISSEELFSNHVVKLRMDSTVPISIEPILKTMERPSQKYSEAVPFSPLSKPTGNRKVESKFYVSDVSGNIARGIIPIAYLLPENVNIAKDRDNIRIDQIKKIVSAVVRYAENHPGIGINIKDGKTMDAIMQSLDMENIIPGYLAMYDSRNFLAAFEIYLPISREVVSQILSYLLPAIYGSVDYVSRNPGTFLSDVNNSADKLKDPYVPPNMRPIVETHSAVSGVNIIKNNIRATMSESANTVSLTKEDSNSTMELSVSPGLTTKLAKSIVDINCEDVQVRTQAIFGALQEEMQKMYRGLLILSGNPRIKPYHYIRVDDYYNSMFGSIEVDKVIHSFNHKSGFTSSIVPHMIVRARTDRGYYAAMMANAEAGFKTMLGLGAALALAIGTFGIGWIGIIAGVGIGIGTGITTSKFLGPGAGQPGWFLGIPYPTFSGQGLFDKSRLNPVKIAPLIYKGAPYVVGLEGWDNKQWTYSEYKRELMRLYEAGWDKFHSQISDAKNALWDAAGEAYQAGHHTAEHIWWNRR